MTRLAIDIPSHDQDGIPFRPVVLHRQLNAWDYAYIGDMVSDIDPEQVRKRIERQVRELKRTERRERFVARFRNIGAVPFLLIAAWVASIIGAAVLIGVAS